MSVSRSLPRVRGAGRVATLIRRMYQRKKREPLVVPVLDFTMRLNPNELVDGGLLFHPQLYDRREIALLKRALRPGDVFFDVGSHIGFYSMVASRCVGPQGRVIAIEADPEIYAILQENIRLNAMANVDALCQGISDRHETLRFGVNLNGNRGSSSFLADDQPTQITIACSPLSDLVLRQAPQRIAAMKVDIEGFGVKALTQFYQTVPKTLFPGLLIGEEEPGLAELMRANGYRVTGRWGFNWVFQR